ncbi:MAG TPA: WXG100 family type VII secretion target [Micromonosporaceae bacterium]|jgi:WXG100 family type VII secretion target|nr:WXG100 family type VII secretion target [Micromonosporaceae bacterium]
MGDLLVVNFVALGTASDHIQAAVKTINDQLTQLEHDAAPLVATWEGPAQAAYAERQRRWRTAAGELAALLAEIKRGLDDSTQLYRGAEDRNVRLFE